MGGIIDAQFLFIDEIKLFSVVNHIAIIKVQDGHNWRSLPIISMNTAPTITVETNNAGTTFKHSLATRFKRSELATDQLYQLRSLNTRGCIIKCQDANGNERIYGTKDYPLFGTITEKQGTSAADYSGYELNLSGTSLYPQLPYTEL